MGNITRKKVIVGSPEESQVKRILKKAMKYYITGTYKHKKDAVNAAIKELGILNNKLPTVDALVNNMTTIEKIHKNNGKYIQNGKKFGIYYVICDVYEDVYGKPVNEETHDKQISLSNADIEEKTSVKAVCPQEDVASQCDEKPEDPEEQEKQQNEPAEVIQISELSAKDKKELAMYAIDQHYFFLKQLTGVI